MIFRRASSVTESGRRRTPDHEQLLRLVVDQLQLLPDAEPFLAQWSADKAVRTNQPRKLPVCRFLPDLLALTDSCTFKLVEALVAASDALEWRQSYSLDESSADFLEGYGWSELIGLRGPVPSETIACGFLLLAPGIEYPRHAHEAEELYVPLAGRALWQRGQGSFAEHPLGSPIHHPSWLPHATRAVTALLCLYVWRGGDLVAKSRFV
jgi:hypothetical protein